jgi:HAD superfamily hydrolase (TIGR01509 family)
MPGIIFDLDGVLIDTEELQYAAYQRVLDEFGVRVSREEYGREWIASGRGPEYAVATYRLPISPAQLRARKNPVYHRILQDEVRLMPGVRPALERLGTRFPLAVATNSSTADVGYVMQRFQLRAFFQAVITREAYEGAKPEPDAFLTAARALGLPPAECVVIEDAHKGVLAAHRAGARCIAVPHDFTAENDFSLADRVLGGLSELTVELVLEVVR